jgi:hypothetical protein
VNPPKERIKRLEKHLQQENPALSGCVFVQSLNDKYTRPSGPES